MNNIADAPENHGGLSRESETVFFADVFGLSFEPRIITDCISFPPKHLFGIYRYFKALFRLYETAPDPEVFRPKLFHMCQKRLFATDR